MVLQNLLNSICFLTEGELSKVIDAWYLSVHWQPLDRAFVRLHCQSSEFSQPNFTYIFDF